MLAVRHCLQNKIFRGFDAAHQLDDDFNFGVVKNFVVVVGCGQSAFLQCGNLARQDEDFFYFNRGVRSFGNYVAIVLQNLNDASADCARAQQSDFYVVHNKITSFPNLIINAGNILPPKIFSCNDIANVTAE